MFGHALQAFALTALVLTRVSLAQSPQVTISGTAVVGSTKSGVEFFGGIPYAEPPVGSLRFSPSVLKTKPDGTTLDASKFGAPCVQFNMDGVSEDCLTLNVFRPASTASNAALPVMVWVHGGSFMRGASSQFDANAIVQQSVSRGTPVIYVSMNYRLGPFGFPQGKEAESLGVLNLGLKDQLVAMEWVNKNIAAFGGDPKKVTIFGQSAGAVCVSSLMLNSGLERYARGAIMQSTAAFPYFDASKRQTVWDTFVSKMPSCANAKEGSTISCMRNGDTATLLTAWEQTSAVDASTYRFSPVIDGSAGVVPDLPSKLLSAGKFSKIPFIMGTNLDEATYFVPQTLANESQLVQFLYSQDQPFTPNPPQEFQDAVDELLKLYPDDPSLGSPYGTGDETFGHSSTVKRGSAIMGDATFQSTRRRWIQAASDAGVQAFGYLFADQKAVTDPSKGVTHTLEIPYVYGQVAQTGTDATDKLVSSAMVDYWVSFAASLTPNDGKGLKKTTWPQYTSKNQVLLQFDTTKMTSGSSDASFPIINDDYRAEQIAYIESVATVLAE